MAAVVFVGLACIILFQSVSAQYYTTDKPAKNMQLPNKFEKQDQTANEKSVRSVQTTNRPLPPLVQITRGIGLTNVKCSGGFVLVFKASNDMPACVRPATAQRLIDLGWAKNMKETITAPTINKISLSAIEEDEVYLWSNSDGSNPTLTFVVNTDNFVQIQNPTDEKHEFVIESDDEEVASSGDIPPGITGMLKIKPEATGSWQYHCEYHPTTMKGTIHIIAP
jgi:hypothetical protein